MTITSFARYPLLFGPSPVHRLERLGAHLGGAEIWAKREDCNSGIAYGGILGVDASAKPEQTREQVRRIASATGVAHRLGRELRDDETELDERYHAGTYGIPGGQPALDGYSALFS